MKARMEKLKKNKIRTPRLYYGNDAPENYKKEFSVKFENGRGEVVDWDVYTEEKKGFFKIKLSARPAAIIKANYWFYYSYEKETFTGRDFILLLKNRPV